VIETSVKTDAVSFSTCHKDPTCIVAHLEQRLIL
jgi:hypothetical protein